MDIEKAIDYVRKNGGRLEQARLDKTLGKEIETHDILAAFADMQNPDGGFPFMDRNGYPSCMSNTALALHTLVELDLGDTDPAQRAIDFFYARQGDDGSWEENHQITPLEPPFWDMPGDPKTTAWLTADITDMLLRAGRGRDKAVGKAVAYFKQLQEPDGGFPGFVHPTWMAIAIFGRKGLDSEDVWSGALGHLEGQDVEEWDSSLISWCMDCLQHGGVPEDSDIWVRLATRLTALQEDDGRFPSEDGEDYDVQTTNNIILISKRSKSEF